MGLYKRDYKANNITHFRLVNLWFVETRTYDFSRITQDELVETCSLYWRCDVYSIVAGAVNVASKWKAEAYVELCK